MNAKKAGHLRNDRRVIYEWTANNLVEEIHRLHRNGLLTTEKRDSLRLLLTATIEADLDALAADPI